MTHYTIDDHHELRPTETPSPLPRQSRVQEHMVHDGMYFVTPLLLGLVAGLAIDGHFGTKPWGTAFFLVAGSIGSFYNVFVLIRSTKQPTHDKTNTPQ